MINRALGMGYYVGLLVLLFSGCGLLYLTVFETLAPAETRNDLWDADVVVLAAGVVAAASAVRLVRLDRKKFVFGTVLLLLLTPVTLFCCEFLVRRAVPAWPAIGLHGVDPSVGATSWGNVESAEGVGFNLWGQRDRPRDIEPAVGTYRIAFVGDSYLEESTTAPVSLRTEQKIGRDDVEVLNLGVSASSPDEYYYRIKNIALPLGVRHCVVFVYSGNDFVAAGRTLESLLGIVAVYPRGSFFSAIGLRGLNHLLTNRRRPVLQAWFASGDLHAREKHLASMLARANDATVRQLLLGAGTLTPRERSRLAARLDRETMTSFYAMLRNPDKGLFRSYYLSSGLWSASVGGGQWKQNREDAAYYWAGKIDELCRQEGVVLTLVITPEAFQVDPRMYEQWKPLTDMRHVTRPCREAALRLCQRARADGIDVIDLHEFLYDLPGTYLNLDGHWSDKGVELVSDVIADWLRETLDEESLLSRPHRHRSGCRDGSGARSGREP